MNEKQLFEENPIFNHFYWMNQIPRCSGQEKAISDALVAWGKEKNLKTAQNEAGNVLIIKPASPGLESAPRVVLQGHMDMVCVKDKGITHDFTCDPIEMEEKDGWLTAKGTTLGADDGIGVAMALALLEEEMDLPEIRVVVTTDEEEGMLGVMTLDHSWLDADMLINIDSEEEGYVTCGCAGGATGNFTIPLKREKVENQAGLHLTLSGMHGGHSGQNILTEPNNACKVMSQFLHALAQEKSLRIVHFHSGEKHNAIPNEAQAWISFTAEDAEAIQSSIETIWTPMQERLLKQEPDIQLNFEACAVDEDPLTTESTNHLLNLMDIMPHGVYRMREDGKNVLASDNLAIVDTKDTYADVMVSVRSSSEVVLEELQGKIDKAIETFGGTGKYTEQYPAWELAEKSPLRDMFLKLYKEETGKEAEVLDIHAGLECGMFAEYNPHLDMISIGPDIEGAHTVNERLGIESTLRTYDILKKLVAQIATLA